MMSEKIVSMFGLIFVTSYVAKYVGPGIFGEIAFATSVFQIFLIVSQLGSEVVLFKRLSKKKQSGIRLINSTIPVRLFVYATLSLPVVIWYAHHGYNESFFFIVASALSCLFVSLDIYSIYYDSQLKSKVNTLINVLALLVCLILRWVMAYIHLPPVYLCIPIVLTGFIPYAFRFLCFKRELIEFPKIKFSHYKRYSKFLILTGSSLVLSAVAIAIYTRLSFLTIKYFMDNPSVGIYSVAVTLAGAWTFVCNSLITSSLPGVFSAKSEKDTLKEVAKINVVVVIVSFVVILSVSLIGQWGINLLYGDRFSLAYEPLLILCAAVMLSLLGTVSSRLIAKYSGYRYISVKTVILLIFSFIINIPMVYYFGLIGGALSALLTELLGLTVLNYFYKDKIVLKSHLYTIKYVFCLLFRKRS
ncbi:TPA: oligosaccharide flippase family protein [Klebsiella quasipneumoniae subsp. similipneumoniae]